MFVHLSDIPLVWDHEMPKGKFAQDANGVWHVGLETKLEELIFEANLNEWDKSFMRSVKVKS